MSDKNQITVTSAPPAPPNRTVSDPAAELLELQLKRERLQIAQLEKSVLELDRNARLHGEEDEKKLAAKEAELAFKRSLVAQLETGRKKRLLLQAHCPHLQENGKTAVGGQRDSHHVNRWICLACMKEWTGNEGSDYPGGLPVRLRPANERVGGPDF